MSTKHGRRRFAAGIAAALLVLASVFASGSSASPATRDSRAASGTLVYGQTIGVTQLDPNTIASAAAEQLLTLLWNGLTKWTPTMGTAPDLASSWSHTKDYKTWTFKLRPNVRFQNGAPFTASVAAQNILRVLDPKVTSQARAQIATIKHVRALNNTTLRIQLSRPTPSLPTSLIAVKMTDIAHIGEINKTANGTGPYKLKSFVPNQTVDLVANPNYFGGRPKVNEIKIVTYSDVTAAESAFRGGNLDLLWAVPPDQVQKVVGGTGGQILQSPQPAGAFVWELDTTSPPFDNPLARQALSYAVNRPAILQAAYSGFGLASLSNDIVSPRNRYFARKQMAYSHNLQKASDLFNKAGVPRGSTLTYWTIAGIVPEWTTAGEILQADLAQIGIKLNIVSKDVNTWAAQFYPRPKKYPGYIIPNFLSFPPLPADYSLQWFSGSGTCECNWQPGAAYDKAFLVADSSTNDKARAAAYIQMQQLLNNNVPVVIIANTASVSVARGGVHGVWIQSDGTPHLEGAS